MTTKRDPIPDAERTVQAVALDALRVQFEDNADRLAEDLCAIAEWLRDRSKGVEYAFLDTPQRLDHCYFLLHEIGRITGRAIRT